MSRGRKEKASYRGEKKTWTLKEKKSGEGTPCGLLEFEGGERGERSLGGGREKKKKSLVTGRLLDVKVSTLGVLFIQLEGIPSGRNTSEREVA